mgnify:CR=1 FL=1|tara:strand:- start:5381 stop:6088 length:708 start_codon:yes stop_codon:yes gene_type:complete
MAVPVGNNHLVNSPASDKNNGAAIYHAGNIDGTNTVTKAITPGRKVMTTHSNKPKEGVSAAETAKAISGGNFANDPSGRTSSNTGFVAKRLPTILAGVSGGSTSNAMYMGGAEGYWRDFGVTAKNPIPVGAKTLTKWAANQFSFLGVSGQRTNWVSGAPASLDSTYHKITGSVYDHAVQVGTNTIYAIPGELTYHEGKAFPTGGEANATAGNTTGATRDEYEGVDRSKAASSLVS